jgi:alpha-L-rhamnosidase
MGFRYAKLETDADLSDAKFTALAVYSQMEQTGTFTCGNDLVNRLVENCIWSQKSNFCGVPTDCPTRERAGWTGDAGIFVDTGLDMMDCYPVFAKWLGDCRCLQHKDGRVTMIAPAINRPGFMTDMLAGSAGWGDASILVPWAMYRRTEDLRILETNYPMMQHWLGYLLGRTKAGKLKKLLKKNPYKQYLIAGGMDYGEWCEPGIDNIKQMIQGNHDVATAYLSWSAANLAQIADVLGRFEDASRYREIAEGAKKAYCAEYTVDGKIESQRQCQYVRPLRFDLLPEETRAQAAADLAQLVKDNGYHLNTGFLSTPYLCEVLAEYGYIEEAQNVLLQEDYPGWLYAVKKGATTVWENWDGIDEQGKVKASLNHYSYGSIAGWLIRSVCGIRQEGQKITISPVVLPQLGYAEAAYDSPVGRIVSAWRCQEDGSVTYTIHIPPNTRAVFLAGDRKIPLSTGVHNIQL